MVAAIKSRKKATDNYTRSSWILFAVGWFVLPLPLFFTGIVVAAISNNPDNWKPLLANVIGVLFWFFSIRWLL